MTTDRDYADLIDPFVRAEVEAFKRGYDSGIVAGILYAIGIGIIVAMILFASKANAAEWTVEESVRWHLPKASERGARIVVCGNNSARREWRCFSVR